MPQDSQWLEQEEIAQKIGAQIWRVRQVVSALSLLGTIRTRPKPTDRRKTEVYSDDVPIVRKAIFGE